MFPEDIAKFWRLAVSYNTSSGCFWQSYHTVKSAGVPVLCFRASTCFQFWSKTFTERCTNNSLLSCDKTISSLLELVGHVLSISEYVFEKHQLLSILMKNLRKALHKQQLCQKTFFPCTLRLVRLVLSISGYDLENERMPKQKYCIKNMAVKIPILVLLRFCLLWWLKSYLFCVLSLL